MNNRKSQAGFSLVELMVVVAIIGILATIAVPNFQRFQAKAKQSGAKVELAGVYTAEKAFFTEYNSYHFNLPAIGFYPDGFNNQGVAVSAQILRYYTTSAGNTGGQWPVSLPAMSPAAFTSYPASATICNVGAAVPTGAGIGANNDTFVAVAAGCPASKAQATKDTWTINENKVLLNTTSGI